MFQQQCHYPTIRVIFAFPRVRAFAVGLPLRRRASGGPARAFRHDDSARGRYTPKLPPRNPNGTCRAFCQFGVLHFVFSFWYFLKTELLLTCATVNLCIFLFNAMPVYSLDGGRALEAYLFEKHSEKTRVRTMFLTSLFCTALVMGAGFFFLFQSGHNFSLLMLSFYLIVTLFKKCGT